MKALFLAIYNVRQINIFFLLAIILQSPATLADNDTTISYADVQQSKPVELHFFWSHRCPHCLEAKPFVENLAKKYSWLNLHSYDLVDDRINVNHYIDMSKQLGMKANSVPGFIFCGQMMVGYSGAKITGKELQRKLQACHENISVQEQTMYLPLIGKFHYEDFSLPVFTLLIAALDAFNPCAFFVLFFLLSLLSHHHSRMRIAAVGGTFVLFSGLMYFLFMAAWLNLFLLTEQLNFVSTLAGGIAMGIGIINIKDYFYFNQGLTLSIPDSAKPGLYQRIRILTQAGHWPAMLLATVVLAIAANSYELLCTAGLPMVYTRVLTLNGLTSNEYYLYLLFYNLVYIVPLLLIVVMYTYTLGNRKLSEQEGRLLKLLSGSMMLGLGGILLFAPDLLNNMYASTLVIFTAVGLTAMAALITKYKKRVINHNPRNRS